MAGGGFSQGIPQTSAEFRRLLRNSCRLLQTSADFCGLLQNSARRVYGTEECAPQKNLVSLPGALCRREVGDYRPRAPRAQRGDAAEATELRLDASTLEKARDSLVSASRAVLAHPADGGFRYLVFDAALAKLSNYFFYIKAWAQTPDGQWYLHVRQRDGTWRPVDLDGEAGPPAISRAAKPTCNTRCKHVFTSSAGTYCSRC